MSNRSHNTRPSRASRERYNPYARPKPPSPTMLPDSFGPEGSDQLIRLAQTAYENQGLDLNNIPDIGRGISTSKWVASQATFESGPSDQRVNNVGNETTPPAFPQRSPPQYNTGGSTFHHPKRHSQSPYDHYGPPSVANPTSHSKWRRSDPIKQHTRKPVIHGDNLQRELRMASAIVPQGSVPRAMPRGPRLRIITQGLPYRSEQNPISYGNPFAENLQEATMHNSIRAAPLPRFHNPPGTFGAQNAGRDPNHGYADPRHYMGIPTPANTFQNPIPIRYGSFPNPSYQMNNVNQFGVLDPRHYPHGGRVDIDPQGKGPNYYDTRPVQGPRGGMTAEFHEHLQRANSNVFNSAITQGARSQPGATQTPMNPYANGGRPIYPPYDRSAVEFRGQNNSRPAHGMESSMTHTNDPNRHLTPRTATPSVSGSHTSESRALVVLDNHSQTSTGVIKCGGSSFRPSRMKMESEGLISIPKVPHNAGSKYLGDPTSKSYTAQIEGLPDDQNCALWITKLHPEVDLPGFLNLVRTGAVFACTINEPEKTWTKAAKLVFKTHEGAADFLAQADAGFEIGGMEIKAVWNRVGYRNNTTDMTRCLQIRGASNFTVNGHLVMNFQFWNSYFTACVVYELEGFREWHENGTSLVEVRFARIDGQAEALWHAIQKDPQFFGHVEVWYSPDPCDPYSGWH